MMDILQLILGKLKAIHTAITGGVRTTDTRVFSGPTRIALNGALGGSIKTSNTCTRARLTAKGVSVRFKTDTVVNVSVNSASDHILIIGNAVEITFPAGSYIAAIADGATGTGSLEISEIA